MYRETKTDRTLVVSMGGGPPGTALKASEYVAWLNRGAYLDEVDTLTEVAPEPNATCSVCQKTFVASRKTAKYCSRICEGRAHRLRVAKPSKTLATVREK